MKKSDEQIGFEMFLSGLLLAFWEQARSGTGDKEVLINRFIDAAVEYLPAPHTFSDEPLVHRNSAGVVFCKACGTGLDVAV